MSANDMKIISAPVIVVMGDTEAEYDNGVAASAAFKSDNRLEVKALSVRGNKPVVKLAVWESGNPSNFVGEAAIAY